MFLAYLLDKAVDEELLAILSMPGVHYCMVCNDAGGFKALFVQTESQHSLFQQYSDVLQLDCTYKVLSDLILSKVSSDSAIYHEVTCRQYGCTVSV